MASYLPPEDLRVGNGVETVFGFTFPYLRAVDIAITVAGVATPVVLVGTAQVSINPAPAVGAIVRIYRNTPAQFPQFLFSGGVPMLPRYIDDNNRQLLYALQEGLLAFDNVLEQAEQVSARSVRVPAGDSPIPELPSVAGRAGRVLSFDNLGRPIMVIPASGEVGDLATSLANQTDPSRGAGQVGYSGAVPYPAGTVGAGINTVAESLRTSTRISRGGANALSQSLPQLVVPLHFGIQRGTGFIVGEPGGIPSTTTTTSHGAGTLAFSVASQASLRAGQLIVYVGVDGRYYTACIKSLGGAGLVTLSQRTEAEIVAGALVAPFYRDDAHANIHGAAAIADGILRELAKPAGTLLHSAHPLGLFRAAGIKPPTLAAVTTSASGNPGTTNRPALLVTAPANNAGSESAVLSLPYTLNAGEYEFRFPLNIGERVGGFSGGVQVDVESTEGTDAPRVLTTFVNTGFGVSSNLVTIPLYVRQSARVRIRITLIQGGASDCTIGDVELIRSYGTVPALDGARVVLFGDSWFSPGGEVHSAMISRLPQSTVLSAGIPGNEAAQMLARFDTDVTPLKPDVVVVCVGTNDYYRDVTVEVFQERVREIRRRILNIGAVPVFLDAAVGALVVPTAPWRGDAMTLSRAYALGVKYRERESIVVPRLDVYRENVRGIELAASAEAIVFVSTYGTEVEAIIRRLTLNQTTLGVRIGYSNSVDGSSQSDVTSLLLTNATAQDIVAPRTAGAVGRYVVVSLYNPTAAPVTASAVLEVQTIRAQEIA